MTLDNIRYWVLCIVSAVCAFVEPLADDLYVMLILFVVNCACGRLADLCYGKDWDKNKFRQSLLEGFLFFVFVFVIYGIGFLKHNIDSSLYIVSFVSYTLVYYYGTNICRNMMVILPEKSTGHKAFAFIYSVLSVEFAKRVPFLNDYLTKTK